MILNIHFRHNLFYFHPFIPDGDARNIASLLYKQIIEMLAGVQNITVMRVNV
jgi:hypothetical protein